LASRDEMTRVGRDIPGLELVRRELDAVEDLLRAEARSEVRLVMDVGLHVLGSGGKRIRPLLTLLSGRLAGLRRKKDLIAYAACMEFSHTSTLLHDDVIDEAELRRGKRSANRLFGNQSAIIVGDYLLFKSFSLMLSGDNTEVVNIMSGVAVEMAEGEAYQLAMKSRPDISEQQYERIIRAKTALLIQTACRIPAVAAGASQKVEKALASYGYNAGIAFQIADDVLDYGSASEHWGKEVGKDFFEGKATLPLILAYGAAGPQEKKAIKEMFKKNTRNKKDLARVQKIFRDTGALELAVERARTRVELAKRSLSIFPDKKPAARALKDLADYVVERKV